MMSEYEKFISEITNCDVSNCPCDSFVLLVEYLKSREEQDNVQSGGAYGRY